MKKYTYTEFVRYSESFEKGKNDFYGKNSPLDEYGTKEFFTKYLDSKKREYGEDCLEKKPFQKSSLRIP